MQQKQESGTLGWCAEEEQMLGRGERNFFLDVLSLMCLQNIQEGMWGWSSRARLGDTDLRLSDSRR